LVAPGPRADQVIAPQRLDPIGPGRRLDHVTPRGTDHMVVALRPENRHIVSQAFRFVRPCDSKGGRRNHDQRACDK
jgi:hypothetical protein